jgi:hypothetical protein
MSEISIITSVLGLGVGGVMGIIIFLMYRRDKIDTEKRFETITEDLIVCRREENLTREKHTAVLSELTTLLTRMNGNKGTKQDD